MRAVYDELTKKKIYGTTLADFSATLNLLFFQSKI
jgi:hypothetical protein